jgi:anti-sigma factor RsiW
MTDCPNAEMRDRLPDLLHERLDAAARALVEAHVGSCADCRAELTLLRETRVALTSGVRSVDVTAIARVVVERTRTPLRSPQRSSWRGGLLDWRVAASIAVLVVGAGTVWLVRGMQGDRQPAMVAVTPAVATPTVTSHAPIAARPDRHESTTTTRTAPGAELSAGGEVGDLSESDLRALLHDLNGMDAVPSTESEPVVVRVSLPGSGGSD